MTASRWRLAQTVDVSIVLNGSEVLMKSKAARGDEKWNNKGYGEPFSGKFWCLKDQMLSRLSQNSLLYIFDVDVR